MKNTNSFIKGPLIALAIVFAISAFIFLYEIFTDPYAYTDIDGNEGYAEWCSVDKVMYCRTGGSRVLVKEFHFR